MMENVIGYVLKGPDNDTFMIEDDSSLGENCIHCGYRTNFFPHNENYVFKKNFKPLYMEGDVVSKSKTPFSYTYDGQVIINKLFKEFCERQGYDQIKFLEFPLDRFHYHFIVERQLPFDAERRRTRFEKLCPVCGNYESVIGATPCYIHLHEPLPDGFFRTDLLFASGNEKHPLILIGLETMQKLKKEKFRGLIFKPAYGLEE